MKPQRTIHIVLHDAKSSPGDAFAQPPAKTVAYSGTKLEIAL